MIAGGIAVVIVTVVNTLGLTVKATFFDSIANAFPTTPTPTP
jgi:Flp pilus assembly pilin Flp